MQEVKAETKREVEVNRYLKRKITCDICKKEICTYSNLNEELEEINYEYDEFEVKDKRPIIGVQINSYNYGDCAEGSAEIYDICYKCYCDKIKPLLKEKFDIEPRKIAYDKCY